MKRKITIAITMVLIVFEIGVSAALFAAGEHRASALITTINAAVEIFLDYTRPYPNLYLRISPTAPLGQKLAFCYGSLICRKY